MTDERGEHAAEGRPTDDVVMGPFRLGAGEELRAGESLADYLHRMWPGIKERIRERHGIELGEPSDWDAVVGGHLPHSHMREVTDEEGDALVRAGKARWLRCANWEDGRELCGATCGILLDTGGTVPDDQHEQEAAAEGGWSVVFHKDAPVLLFCKPLCIADYLTRHALDKDELARQAARGKGDMWVTWLRSLADRVLTSSRPA